MPAIMVYVTVKDASTAREMARLLVQERLVACANIVPSIVSIYRWGDQVQEDDESLLLLKTTERAKSALVERIVQLHEYDCPAVVAYAAVDGSQPYLDYLEQSVSHQGG